MDIKNFLADYVKFKSVSCDVSRLSEMEGTRHFLLNFLTEIGFSARDIKTDLHNMVLAKNKYKPGRPSVLLYGHYDVQPEGDGWTSDPFTLSERSGRLYARGASDNKGGNATMLMALHDIFRENSDLPLNVTVLLEGEEEIGSPNMAKFLSQYGDELVSDFALVADTWSIDDENIVITTALRGLVGFEVKLKSAEHDIHSGYGGTVINPIRELVRLCASLHTPDGLVNISGFYDDVEQPSEFEIFQSKLLPFTENELLHSLGARKLSTNADPRSVIDSMKFYPTLEFNGIAGGYDGDGIKTIIPSEASVKITCRLVCNQDAHKVKELVSKTILERVDKNIEVSVIIEKDSNPYNLLSNDQCFNRKSTIGRGLAIADEEIKHVFGKNPLYIRDGGSIPLMRMMKDRLSLDSILIGLSSTDDRIHAPDESISINMLHRGREFFKCFFQKFALA